MNDFCSHDQVIAKIQHFSEFLNQVALEKESLLITLGKCQQSECIKDQINIYKNVLNHYNETFEDIIHKDL